MMSKNNSPSRFEDIKVGDTAEVRHRLTAADVAAFVALTGDDNPLHVDAAYAATTTLRKPVAHGMLTASFISTLIGTRLPGAGALWYDLDIRFLAPARVGEEIVVRGTVRQKSPAIRALTLALDVSADGRALIEGTAHVKCVDAPPAAPEKEPAATAGAATPAATPAMNGRAVIVTGGGRGIGAAICRALAEQGFAVAVNYRRDAAGAEALAAAITARGGRAVAIGADISDPGQADALYKVAVERLGPLAGLVNNAAPPILPRPFVECEWDDLARHLDVQVKGAFLMCRRVLPDLIAQGGGRIVTVASSVVEGTPPVGWTAYTVGKTALVGLTRSLAAEAGPKGVTVNCVAPGMTETDLIADFSDKAKMLARMQTPLRRLARPEDVAGVVAFLFGAAAAHITGETIHVSGGATMK